MGKHQSPSGGRRSKGKVWAGAFIMASVGKARKSRVSRLRIGYFKFSRLWGIRAFSSCLVPGPLMIKAEEHCLLYYSKSPTQK